MPTLARRQSRTHLNLNQASYQRRLLFLLPPLRVAFFPLVFDDFFALLFDLDDFFDFPRFTGLRLVDEALAFAALPLFFAVRLPLFFAVRLPLFFTDFLTLFPRFFGAAEGFLLRLFAVPLFDGAFALAATALTAFFAGGGAELAEAAARPAIAPITPPTTAPTGPATLPRTAPVAIPAVCFEIGGISMFSDDEPDVSVDC